MIPFISPLLQDIPFIGAFFVKRAPGMQLHADRQETLKGQMPFFQQTVQELFPSAKAFLCAKQVHGSDIAIIDFLHSSTAAANCCVAPVFPASHEMKLGVEVEVTATSSPTFLSSTSTGNLNCREATAPETPCTSLASASSARSLIKQSEVQQDSNVDGLMTIESNIVLGITVADCAPVWIIDSQRKAVALVHSGRRGTEAGIVPKAIQQLQTNFESQAKDLIIIIGPCIRTPCYEIDFPKTIREQAMQAGVREIRDEGICTACHLDEYYSYRREKGKTGHMLALVMKHSD